MNRPPYLRAGLTSDLGTEAIFGAKKLDLIEACFEGFHRDGDIARDYHYAYGTNRDQLRAILANIVHNEGEFILKQDLT